MRPVRQEIMWQAVLDALATAGADEGRADGSADGASPSGLDVVDVGGGTGGDAVRLATLGHRVTVVDPSPDALASLDRRAVESDVVGSVHGRLADTSDLSSVVPDASADLALLHGVLEHVDDPAEALDAVRRVLRPGGVLSVVVAGRPAAVLARAVAGDFTGALELFDADAAAWDRRAHGPRRYVRDEIESLLQASGLRVVSTSGLRVFADLVPSAVVDGEPGARERLYALERAVRSASEFSGISGGLHCTARLDL